VSSDFKDWLKRYRWPLALAAAAFAVRAVYFFTVADDPFFTHIRNVPDASFFNNWAQGIASGDWRGGDEVFFIGPLYAYFLGIIYRLVGPQLTVVRVIHIAMEVGSTLFIYGFTRRAVGDIFQLVRTPGVAGRIFDNGFVLPISARGAGSVVEFRGRWGAAGFGGAGPD
jgi:hypothetical protein